jgi:hypothetical protein
MPGVSNMSVTINRNVATTAKCGVFFGGFLNQFGWSFFGFGLIFFWTFAMNADLSFIHFIGDVVTVKGVATNSFETGASQNKTPVFKNSYKLTTEEGIEFKDSSYSSRNIRIGETIVIEYPKGKPQYSRIKGMRRQIFGPIVLFVVIFPVAGLVLLFFSIKKSLRALRLLKYGELTKGKFISKEPTNTGINGQNVYKLTFRFMDTVGNEYDVSEETHLPHLLEDNNEKRLLYLKSNPSYAIMLDSLPHSPSIDEYGNVKTSSPIKSILSSIFIPLATIVGHGLYITFYF